MGNYRRRRGWGAALVLGMLTVLTTSPLVAAAASVEANYKKFCSACHGEDGSGNGPAAKVLEKHPGNFTDCAAMKSRSHDFLVKIISEGGAGVGRSSQMPASAKKLSADEIGALATYISTHFCKEH